MEIVENILLGGKLYSTREHRAHQFAARRAVILLLLQRSEAVVTMSIEEQRGGALSESLKISSPNKTPGRRRGGKSGYHFRPGGLFVPGIPPDELIRQNGGNGRRVSHRPLWSTRWRKKWARRTARDNRAF